MSEGNKVTFVLTGPRKGYTGMLGGRYGFREGELTVEHSFREGLRIILCNHYACNIKGEAPLWDTVEQKDGKLASVKITDIEKPKKETTTVKAAPVVTTTDGGASQAKSGK